MDYASVVSSADSAAGDGADQEPRENIWISSRDSESPGWCTGASLDAAISGFGGLRSQIIEEVCDTELAFHTVAEKLEVSRDSQDGNGTASLSEKLRMGWSGSGFVPGLLAANSSWTLYFRAKTSSVAGATAPRITAMDGDNNLCFSLRGDVGVAV